MAHPEGEPLAPLDAVWWQMDDPTNLMMITAVLIFAVSPSRRALEELVRGRLVARFPRFRQRVVGARVVGGRPAGALRWVEQGALDLDAHLRFERLDGLADEAALQVRVGELMSTPLPSDRPLWQVHLVEGLRLPAGEKGEGAALIARFHHCLADGLALAQVLLSLTDEAGPPAPPRAAAAHEHDLHALLARLRHPGHLARRAADAAWELGHLLALPADHTTPLRGALGVQKRATWTRPVPLSRIKAIGGAHGATLNDVFLAAVTGALRRWLLARGSAPPEIRVFVPVNLRPLDAPIPPELGNHFSLVFLGLPVGLAWPRQRLAEVKRRMDALKDGTEALVAYGILGLTGLGPEEVEQQVVALFARKGSAVLTNVPGPKEVVHLAGAAVQGIWFWVPQAGRVGLGISVFSYAGNVSVGIAGDAGLVPSPEELAQGFEAELDLLA